MNAGHSDNQPGQGQSSLSAAGPANLEHLRLQALLLSAADHEILVRGIACFRRLFAGDRSITAAAEFNSIKWLLHQKLTEHFEHEDRHLFPGLLASQPSPPVAVQIAALTREHVALLAEAHRLTELLARQNLGTCRGDLWTAMLNFFEGLEKHSQHEDALLLHLLDK